jgi:hypothetical protein
VVVLKKMIPVPVLYLDVIAVCNARIKCYKIYEIRKNDFIYFKALIV